MDNTLSLLKERLDKEGLFNTELPELLQTLTETVVAHLPEKMKLTLAVSEIVLFTSQYRKNIKHWNGSLIPINAITFCLAKSGAAKDSSVKMIRKCFKPAYNKLHELKLKESENLAIQTAIEEGEKTPYKWQTYKKYHIPPNPLVTAPSTVEGFIQHLNDVDKLGIGAGFMYTGEFGSELASNSTFTDNIRLLAELYDEGTKEVKVLKDRNSQSQEIENFPVSALFIGSQDNLLLDENVKRKFKTEFTTKLARRSFFNFNKKEVPQKAYKNLDEMLADEKERELKSARVREIAEEYITELHEYLSRQQEPFIKVADEVIDLFILYKKYNENLAETMEHQLQISKLARQHLQWKALKLSGAFALIKGDFTITAQEYKEAATFTEMLHEDIIEFEKELSKEPYEMFVDYVHNYIGGSDSMFVDVYTLKKLGYLPSSTNLIPKIKDFSLLVSSCDPKGIYTPKENGINFQKIQKNDEIGIAFLRVSGNKADRKRRCATGYEYGYITFKELADVLEEDLAFCPFEFKDGVRGKENLLGTTRWIALDIDKKYIKDEEAHILLEDINHHIARTSDPDNPYKFRLLLELDSEIDVPDNEWKYFLESISMELGIGLDLLPKSQIFYSYAGRNILSVTDEKPLSVKEHLINASHRALSKEKEKPKSKKQKSDLLSNRRETFNAAYEAKDGEGSRKLVWAAKYAIELGADYEEVVEIVSEINEYWVHPLEETRFQNTIIKQIKRWF